MLEVNFYRGQADLYPNFKTKDMRQSLTHVSYKWMLHLVQRLMQLCSELTFACFEQENDKDKKHTDTRSDNFMGDPLPASF
jgi:hypothetical protein